MGYQPKVGYASRTLGVCYAMHTLHRFGRSLVAVLCIFRYFKIQGWSQKALAFSSNGNS